MHWRRQTGLGRELSAAGRNGAGSVWTVETSSLCAKANQGQEAKGCGGRGGVSRGPELAGLGDQTQSGRKTFWIETDEKIVSPQGQKQWKRKLGAERKVRVRLDNFQR